MNLFIIPRDAVFQPGLYIHFCKKSKLNSKTEPWQRSVILHLQLCSVKCAWTCKSTSLEARQVNAGKTISLQASNWREFKKGCHDSVFDFRQHSLVRNFQPKPKISITRTLQTRSARFFKENATYCFCSLPKHVCFTLYPSFMLFTFCSVKYIRALLFHFIVAGILA